MSDTSPPTPPAVGTAAALQIPGLDGRIRTHRAAAPPSRRDWDGEPVRTRIVYAAAHVTVDPLHPGPAHDPAAIDWESTMRFRHHMWELGLGVAEAMDTAQRGAGLTWDMARELIIRSGREATSVGGALVCGATTDQLAPDSPRGLDRIGAAYIEQCNVIADAGGIPAVMPSAALVGVAAGADDYVAVYDRIVRETSGPLVLHWLGEPFAPHLRGYWGSTDLDRAAEVVLDLLTRHERRFLGIKVSLLDIDREVSLRQRLPGSVRLLTGDDFNYVDLIRGDEERSSDALLGAFAAIAPVARQALAHLDDGDDAAYEAVLRPTEPLARHLFQAPTADYKTGIVFLAYLNGHQDHFIMLDGAHSKRSVLHLCEVFRLADTAGALLDIAMAVERMRRFLMLAGVEQ